MTASGFHLHGFFRSSTSFRVRMALNLKGIMADQSAYVLRQMEHKSDDFLALNPQGLVPVLTTPDGTNISQSLAIMEWLDEEYPEPKLLPADSFERAKVRELAHIIALDIHPVNNLRVLAYLQKEFAADEDAVSKWFNHWVHEAFSAVEHKLASGQRADFCFGDQVSLADICLVAQSVNNRRFKVDETPYPNIRRIVSNCLTLDAIVAALPENQPDAA